MPNQDATNTTKDQNLKSKKIKAPSISYLSAGVLTEAEQIFIAPRNAVKLQVASQVAVAEAMCAQATIKIDSERAGASSHNSISKFNEKIYSVSFNLLIGI